MKPSELKAACYNVYMMYRNPSSAFFIAVMDKKLKGAVSRRKLKNLYKEIQNEIGSCDFKPLAKFDARLKNLSQEELEKGKAVDIITSMDKPKPSTII